MMTLGVVGRSRKENEHRLPIHPDHFDSIPESVRSAMVFEQGYGRPFGVSDAELGKHFGRLAPRAKIFEEVDVLLLPKPLQEDLEEMPEGGILWGWPHCVQQFEIAQAAIERRLTLIAWEAMYRWRRDGVEGMHLFERNNEMAGYCGVIHALSLAGIDGYYGTPCRARILSHGSVSRGAIHALKGRGFREITVFTQRPSWAVHDKILGCRYAQMVRDPESNELVAIEDTGRMRPLIDALSEADVIVNGILQDTDDPLMFLREGEERQMKPGALIVDISCDLGMGFSFARPTSFEEPTFEVGPVTYYAVDHTPSHLWRSASWELSRVVVPFLSPVMEGPESWEKNETIRRAIEIRDGVVQNPKILRFQNRKSDYPHERG